MTTTTPGPVWHQPQGMLEHAHATEAAAEACAIQAAEMAAWREQALANYYREDTTA